MKRAFLGVIVLIGAASSAWAQMGKNPAIDKTRAAYEKAAAAGNVADLVALYTADAVIMAPDMPMAKGRAAVEAFHKKMFEGAALSNVRITPTTLEMPSADVAIEAGTYTQTITPKGGAPMHDVGKYIVVLKRQGETWKLAYEIYNSDKPMAMPTAPKK
jgi:uncharacterized protein (TIGR02246 family)